MPLALLWSNVTGFVKKIPDWAWWLFIAIATAKFIDMRARADQRDRDKAREEKAQTKTRSEMIERKSTIVQEERRNADQALAARNSGPAPAVYDELSDTDKAIAEGRARSRFERSP